MQTIAYSSGAATTARGATQALLLSPARDDGLGARANVISHPMAEWLQER